MARIAALVSYLVFFIKLLFGNEMSQDQVYGLLMGFMCVKQWVGGDLVVNA
ncbi:MAG: hypothetical protein JNL57_11025 [Bacteroidetes bacterium]|nr:hypothetical protein [Bacteroidota bacterium]